eukprot:IDg13837t1
MQLNIRLLEPSEAASVQIMPDLQAVICNTSLDHTDSALNKVSNLQCHDSRDCILLDIRHAESAALRARYE